MNNTATTNIGWVPGREVVLPANEGRAVLVERLGTYPTSRPTSLARWEVALWSDYLKDFDRKNTVIRPIWELGITNGDVAPSVDYAKYTIGTKSSQEETQDEVVVKPQVVALSGDKRRGRPEGPMNLLKAQNQIRAWKKNELTTDEIMDAVDFMIDNGFESYVEKHVFANLTD